MHTVAKLLLPALIIAVAAVWSGPLHAALAAEGAASSAASSGDYKIGVVDMDEVLKGYNALKTQVDALAAEAKQKQSDIDSRSDALKKEMEALKSAPEADREKKSDEIKRRLRDLNADLTRMQGELDDKRAKLQARTRQDVIKTIQQIGAAENYHLILEGDTDGRSTVIYFTSTINITPKVIEKLNAGSPAPAAAPSSGAPAAKKK